MHLTSYIPVFVNILTLSVHVSQTKQNCNRTEKPFKIYIKREWFSM